MIQRIPRGVSLISRQRIIAEQHIQRLFDLITADLDRYRPRPEGDQRSESPFQFVVSI
jgi:hypothetical protein